MEGKVIPTSHHTHTLKVNSGQNKDLNMESQTLNKSGRETFHYALVLSIFLIHVNILNHNK